MLEWLFYNYKTYGDLIRDYHGTQHISLEFSTDMSGELICADDDMDYTVVIRFDNISDGVTQIKKLIDVIKSESNN